MKPRIYTRVHNSSIKKTHGSHIEKNKDSKCSDANQAHNN